MKRSVSILTGIVLISSGIGLLSLKHYGFSIKNYKGVNTDLNNIGINSNKSSVEIGSDGVYIKDKNNRISVNTYGIDIRDGKNDTNIKVEPGFNFKIGNFFNNFNITNSDLVEKNVNQKKFESMDGINFIDIATPFINVNIIPEEREDIKIHYNGYLKSNYIPELETKRLGNILYITFKRNNSNSYSVSNSDIKLNIYIPNNYEDRIKVITSSGDINVSKLELSQLNLTTNSGDIIVKDVTLDTISTETSSGNQIIKSITSTKSNLIASSGDINVYNFIGDMVVETSSGEIKLNYNEFNKDINATTSSGNVKIVLPESSQFNIDAYASSGNITTEFPVTIMDKQKCNLTGKVGNSSNNIEIITSLGDIEIKNK
ncbi:DUF4097 domain-containing protein [Schnuerera sp. xch1]|uniref:DUF4097 family beta strand repeat-containing protein n=1 Tax=Schnuerera sp. xch1 TaxID=2874283 RepID=UPI001CBE6A37|nr:DUF4097 family beta strand repeat-containing protein [Schnuerera sp. xch1]MBZ2174210.1 DUF4097 domain-containing protein [Schnuerera sp. xch1]